MEIVALKKGELELCRTLRLKALKDAPGTFAETYSQAITEPLEYWENIVEALTPPGSCRMFIARDSGCDLGSVYALLDSKDIQTGRLGGMWVDANFRDNGVGTALFNAVKTWALNANLRVIKLWVEDSEEGARAFYLKLGFEESGVKDITRIKIDKNLCEMKLIL